MISHPARRKVSRVFYFHMQTCSTTPITRPPPGESVWETLRSFPGPVWILFVGVFLNKFGTFVIPFLTLYLTRRGFSAADAGLAFGAYGVGRLGSTLIGGHLADTL